MEISRHDHGANGVLCLGLVGSLSNDPERDRGRQKPRILAIVGLLDSA